MDLSRLALASLLAACLAQAAAPAPDQIEFFEKQVRPLLVSQCHACHSSKGKQHFAGLALDTRAGVEKGSDAGPVVVAGKPAESKLIKAVRGELPMRMPPAGNLKDDQIATLVRWVEMGAPWPDEKEPAAAPLQVFDADQRAREHWAWHPVRATAPPPVRDEHWPLQDVDRFILAKLENEGLRPALPADRRLLLRRLSFDLTGLPPSPEELSAFVADRSPAAWEKQVDRLLALPAFAEHWARHWMDLVRYAESHGSEGDPDTPQAWRYRDYLIRAIQNDVPYDQLIREHLAGDLLAQPRRNENERLTESMIGLANFRMVEHGFQPVDPWEDRVKWADNQIDVFSKAFQGLTISCARCHDHKFDAISQKDFYALFGIFAGARPTQRAIDLPEDLNRNRDEMLRVKREIQMALGASWKQAALNLPASLRQEQPAKESDAGPLLAWQSLRDKSGDSFRAGWKALAEHWRKESEECREFNAANFKPVWDVRRDYSNWVTHGTGVPERASPPGGFWVLPAGDRAVNGIYPGGVYTNLLSSKHNGVIASPRFRIDSDAISVKMLGGSYSFAQLIIENYAVPRGGIYNLRITPKTDSMEWCRFDTAFWNGFTAYIEFATMGDVTHFAAVDGPQKTKLEVPKDGRSWFGAQAVYFHNNKLTPKSEPAALLHLLDGEAPASAEALAQRYVDLLCAAIEAWTKGTMSEAQAGFLDFFVRNGMLPSGLDALENVRPLIAEYRKLEEQVPVARRAPGVFEEGAPDQPLLIRGNHKSLGAPVPHYYLQALHGEQFNDPRTVRLRLAEAVASPANPLTARVMVNRLWQRMFGAGIVRTVDNFGKLGEGPSHPELLDWLATRFVQDGWSMKKTLRLLATSQTYRTSSSASEQATLKDPANRWLQHMPVRRLEAEAIRDSILWVSGQLDLQMFGPSVPTYYAHDTGRTKGDREKGPLDGAGRRSVYLEVRRNVTNPFLDAFDVPKPSTTRGERDLTNVPAQSLALLNNPFVIDQSAKWMSQDSARNIEAMFVRALGRAPSPLERDRIESLLADLRKEHAGNEAFAWRDLAHSIFNLKEFLYVR